MTGPSRFRQTRRSAATLAAIAATLAAACARGAIVTPPPTPVYAVSVQNSTMDEIVVSYDDGAASRALGTVLAGRTERFVIAAPASTTVEIFGRAATGDTAYGPFRVSLVAGSTVPVTIR